MKKTGMYKAIIFDFFDVIHRDPFNHWLRQNGLERSGVLEETARLFDLGEIDLEEHHRLVSDAIGKPVDGIKAVFDDTSFIDTKMVEFIKHLKNSYKICLLSNSGTEYIDQIIDQHDLGPLFDVIIISSEVGLVKPDHRIFEYALDKLGVAADQAVFIDDNPKNTAVAAGLGIKSIVYKDVGSLKKELAAMGLVI